MHQNPEERELWTEDLAWVQALIAHRHKEKVDGEEVSFIMQMRKKELLGVTESISGGERGRGGGCACQEESHS